MGAGPGKVVRFFARSNSCAVPVLRGGLVCCRAPAHTRPWLTHRADWRSEADSSSSRAAAGHAEVVASAVRCAVQRGRKRSEKAARPAVAEMKRPCLS
jgi:hypothetical protein